jgi:putative ABC transport system substrate-binding protein
MDRRAFVAALASGMLAAPRSARAQPAAAKPVGVGVLRAAPDAPLFRQNAERFLQALRENGFVEGTNLAVEFRVRAGRTEDMAVLAAELVRLRMDGILAVGPAAVQAAAGATKAIPIVAMDLESDPVAAGFATSLARPGKNVTGVFLDFPELSGKWIQLLRELVPKLARIAAIWDPSTPANLLRGAETAARTLRVELFPLEALTAEDFAPAFRSAADKRVDALMVLSSPVFYSARPQIVAGAARHRLPTIMPFPEFADHGGLIAYGPNVPAMFRQAGEVMVKVLRGTRPGDIPLELPARFELSVNRKTAASLGLTVPHSLLVRADRVVE